MAKLSLSDVASGYNLASALNANNDALEAALENTLSRDGTAPNGMNANLDMNSKRIINVGSPEAGTDAARWADVTSALAITTILPAQTGNSGKYVTTDGTNLSWSEAFAKYARTAAEITAGITPTNYFYPPMNVKRYGATGDGVTNDGTALQAAINVAEVDGGEVFVPAGNYLYTTALDIGAVGVTIAGEGAHASVLEASACNGVNITYYTGFSHCVIKDIGFNGNSCTTHVGINQPGSLDNSEELYGLTLQNVYVTNFNVACHLRQARNVSLINCWFQHVHKGLRLVGACYLVLLIGNKFTYGNGCGAGDVYGLELDSFNFTSGSGVTGPEGVHFKTGQIFGFDTCVYANFGNYINLGNADLSGKFYGVRFTTIQNGFNITDSFVEMQSANALAAIKGEGLASVIAGQVNITNTRVLGNGTTTGCTGIQINDAGNQNQNFVNIVGCSFSGMQGYDILLNNPGQSNVVRNRCESTGVTESIKIGTRQSGRIVVTQNQCAGGIEAEDADCLAGHVRIYDNIDDGTNTLHAEAIGWYEEGTWTPIDSSGAALSLVGAVGTYTKNGNTVTARCQWTYPATADGSNATIGGLPYSLPASGESRRQGVVSYSDVGTQVYARPALSGTTFVLRKATGSNYTNAEFTGKTLTVEITYTVDP